MKDNKEYDKLKELLEEDFSWPGEYMFKFIVPFLPKTIEQTEALFDANASITMRESKSLKYMSITAKQIMKNPSEVIAVYHKAEAIEGIMGL